MMLLKFYFAILEAASVESPKSRFGKLNRPLLLLAAPLVLMCA